MAVAITIKIVAVIAMAVIRTNDSIGRTVVNVVTANCIVPVVHNRGSHPASDEPSVCKPDKSKRNSYYSKADTLCH